MEREAKLIKGALYHVGKCASGKIQGIPSHKIRARWTGETRPPRKGEWFLSGAFIGAYQAPNDLSTPYYIAELVTVEVTTQYNVTGIVPLEELE